MLSHDHAIKFLVYILQVVLPILFNRQFFHFLVNRLDQALKLLVYFFGERHECDMLFEAITSKL
jgi:hypothetical protein